MHWGAQTFKLCFKEILQSKIQRCFAWFRKKKKLKKPLKFRELGFEPAH